MENLILTSLPTATEKQLYLKGMVQGYLECAQWTNEDLDDTNNRFNISTLKQAINDCGNFLTSINYQTKKIPASQMGHDFWLTRNGHGAGFWDRDLGDYLTEVSKLFKEVNIELGDNGLINIYIKTMKIEKESYPYINPYKDMETKELPKSGREKRRERRKKERKL